VISERWQKIEELFQAAVERPREERNSFLAQACAGDKSLRREIEALLASDADEESKIDDIASSIAADWMTEKNCGDLIGHRFGRYEILSPLGSGGMGEVYLAQDTSLLRKVALKLLPRQFTQNPDRLRRFEQEARAASALNHPNIITIYDIVQSDAGQFIATEYIEGETLRDRMHKGRMELAEVLEIGNQIAGALAAAHSAGIVHRDIKPANIMLRADGYIKVLDFGLAKLIGPKREVDATDPGRVMGTIAYMSPEQALGQELDHRTDIFSLGVVLYEMATGVRPFDGKSDAAIYDAILNKTPRPLRDFDPISPPELDQIVQRALEKNREERYQSAAELRADLEQLHHPTHATLASAFPQRLLGTPGSAKRLTLWGASIALAIGVLSLWFITSRGTGSRERSVAVLPFENLSEDKANAYFASGMQDEIVTKLAQLGSLRVISRAATGKYEKLPRDLKAISRELHVATVLEGSVQRSGDNLLINVQLVDPLTENHLWAESYNRRFENIFDVEAEVARNVADALKVKVAPSRQERILAVPTTNPQAHDLFLRAHALGAHSDEQSLERKIALLQQAVAADPHYAMAWGDLAGAYLTIADAYRAPLDVLGPMRHAALVAVESDDKAAVGHIWRGAVAMLYDRDFPLAKRELARAVELDPNSSDAHRWYGWYLARVERKFDAGRTELQRARTLDPFYTWPLLFESYIDIAQGDYKPALQLAERVMEIDPRFFYDVDPVAHVYVAMGRWEDARKRYESLPTGTLTRPNFEVAVCYANLGETDRARSILADLQSLANQRYIDQMHIAAIHAALGDNDHAFAALNRAADERSARVSTPRFFPWLTPLFKDPKFTTLENKVAHSAIATAPTVKR
jgi:serine/threonine protein kinase/tetratricopeptide (TPR) repeat protein